MLITALAGGIGGARFLRGLLHELRAVPGSGPAGAPPHEGSAEPSGDHRVTVIGNTADDVTLHGLRVCPDLDTVMYTLGGGISEERGWGREDEGFVVKEELAAYGVEPSWFGLGDRDTATHLVRTQMLAAGYPLSAVTAALCARWQPGAWPLRLCAPEAALAGVTAVRVLGGADVPARSYILTDTAGLAADLLLGPCDGATPARTGLLQSAEQRELRERHSDRFA